MAKLFVEGPAKIAGEIPVGGNKNAVLPMIAAALLTDDPVILHNVPDILDVRNMLSVIRVLGAETEFRNGTLTICAKNLRSAEIPMEQCSLTRTSLLFAGPLAMRFGSALIWPPGGDMIGRRRLDSHFYGLRKLGITVEADQAPYHFTRTALLRSEEVDMFLDEASVTATEHIMTAAAYREGVSIIRNAASEPHIGELAELLQKMGAEISGIDTNTLTIRGTGKLHGAEHTVAGDHIEAASFLALCAATGGKIDLTGNIFPRHYWMMRRVLERFGENIVLERGHIGFRAEPMKICMDFGNLIPTIADGPWPQFPSDMMSCMIVAATQASGTVLFFEKMYESRIYFVDRLIAMGANAIVCDPHRVVISGPARLHATEMASPDIRAGMAMIIAGCCAEGTTVVNRAEVVRRGYENLTDKLTALGVRVRQEA